jgi:hypothetical protein
VNESARLSARWVYAAIAAYILGFVLFWPRVLLVVDEERYVSQAMAFAEGTRTSPGSTMVARPSAEMISDYPPATSLLQAPLVWAGGWRAAPLLSVFGLIAATLVTMLWLRRTGGAPAFALVVPGFFGIAFFGRVAMSDVPSSALVALTCYLLWRADRGKRAVSFGAGFCAGASLLFREPIAILVAPLLAGAVLRREAATGSLIAGVAVGVCLRLVLMQLLFGSPLYLRDPGYGFALDSLRHALPVYALILLVMFPSGAVLPFAYRGVRRRELVAAVALYVTTFLLYEYDVVRDNGPIKGIVLASRFIAPLTPVLAFMAAEVWPRWLGTLTRRLPGGPLPMARVTAAGVVALAFIVHPLARREETVPLAIVRAMYTYTAENKPVVTNSNATLKYLSPAYGARLLIQRYDLSPDSVVTLQRRYGGLSIALLDRSDSEMFRQESADNRRFLEDVQRRCDARLAFQRGLGGWADLRILDVAACR